MRTGRYSDGTLASTADYLAAATGSPTVTARAHLYLAGNVVELDVPLSSGSVTWDRQAAVRSRCSATLPTKRVATNLSAAGHEIELWRGVIVQGSSSASLPDYVYVDGEPVLVGGEGISVGTIGVGVDSPSDTIWVSLGIFAIQSVDAEDSDGEAVISVSGDDLSRKVADARLADAVTWTTADVLETVVADLINTAVPYLTFYPEGTTHMAPAVTHERGADPWSIVVDAAKAVGFEVWVDGWTVRWRPEPDLSTVDPVLTVADGEGGRWVSGSVGQDRGGAFNEWPVTGSNGSSTAEYTAVAYDDDPLSPAYYLGPFGRKPAPVERLEQIDSQVKADDAAAGRRNKERGVPRTITVKSWPVAVLEAGDAVQYVRGPLAVDEVALVDVLSMGVMFEDSMTMTARART